jgi:hypothetical protein
MTGTSPTWDNAVERFCQTTFVVGVVFTFIFAAVVWWRARKQEIAAKYQRGFEVELTAGQQPASQRKANDHG